MNDLIPFACIVVFAAVIGIVTIILNLAPRGDEIEGVGFVRDEDENKTGE